MTMKLQRAGEATVLAPLDPLRRYSVEDAIAYLATSRASIYKAINGGKLKTITDGKRRLVPGSEIVRLCTVQP